MRQRAFRAAVTAAVFCISSFLLACPWGQLNVQIPDFFSSDVQGIRLYRLDDASGQLVDAGHIEFLAVEKTQGGNEMLKYRQLSPEGEVTWGPVYTRVERIPEQPNALAIRLGFVNQLPSGWFKVASYNLIGTSRPSATQTFIELGADTEG
jgi:hypothetical protein